MQAEDLQPETTPSPSRAQREAWLSEGSDLALAALQMKPAARERFLLQLEFEGDALVGFSLEELQDVLPLDQLQALILSRVRAEDQPQFAETLAELAAKDGQSMVAGMTFFAPTETTNTSAASGAKPTPLHRRNINGVSAEPFDLATLMELEKENLLRVFSITMSIELQDRHWFPIFLNALEALQQRRMTTPKRLAAAQRALLLAGCFEQARSLAERYPKARLQVIPPMTDCREHPDPGPSVWKPAKLEEVPALQRQALDVSGTRWWIVGAITHSKQAELAAAALQNDPTWEHALNRFGGWITMQLGAEPLDVLTQWHARHTTLPAWPAADRSDWLISGWDVPNIVVTRDGAIIETLRGWQDQEAAMALLARHGLMQRRG